MKKRSKSFKDAVSKSLDETIDKKKKKSNDELIEELYGSGSYVPAGLTVASRGTSSSPSRGLMPPYSSMTDPSAAVGGIDMRDNQPDSDIVNPPVMPFPLDTAIEHLVSAYNSLMSVEEQFSISVGNPALSEEKTKMIKKLDNKIRTIVGHIKKVAEEMGTVSLD